MKKRSRKFYGLWILCIMTALLLLSPYIKMTLRHIMISSIKSSDDFDDTLPLSETLTKEQAQEDIKAVFTTISKKHNMKELEPDMFKKVEDTYQNILSKLYDGITVLEIWILSSELEHTLLDAHSCVRLNLKDKEKYHYVGSAFRVEDDGTIWYEKDDESYLLKSINGISAPDIYKNASRRMSYENIYYLSNILEKQLSDAENMQLLDIPWEEKGVTVCYEKDSRNVTELIPYKPYSQMKPEDDCASAAIVGEETGGSPNSYGEVRYYSMPNSRLLYRVTQKYFSVSGPWSDADTIHPDIKVPEEEALEEVKDKLILQRSFA